MMEEGDYVACQFSVMRFLNVSLVSTDVEYPIDLISQGAKVVSKLAYKNYNYMPRFSGFSGFFYM